MTKATDKQMNYIGMLTRKLGLGSYASHGIKAVLGKNPVNFTSAKASEVIEELKKRAAQS